MTCSGYILSLLSVYTRGSRLSSFFCYSMFGAINLLGFVIYPPCERLLYSRIIKFKFPVRIIVIYLCLIILVMLSKNSSVKDISSSLRFIARSFALKANPDKKKKYSHTVKLPKTLFPHWMSSSKRVELDEYIIKVLSLFKSR